MYALKHAWTVDDVHIYIDGGISGAESVEAAA
jgi:hypothetical protein